MDTKFSKGFYWGGATSAHQVEGENVNDWSEWEKENAERLAEEANLRQTQGKNIWPDYILKNYPNPLQAENYISGRACDHYHLYEKDFDIAKSLGHNAYRFSIEWSRIEPEEGKFNEAEIEHYRKVISALKKRGLEPFVTLWHWTNPLWIRDIGGWKNKKTIGYFLRYTELIVKNYGDLVKFWIPLNEPGTYIALGYIKGTQPPGVKNIFQANKVFKNTTNAHKMVCKLIHSSIKNAQVGISHYTTYRIPPNNFFWNGLLIKFLNYITDKRFIKRMEKNVDFLGIQYYRPEFTKLKLGGQLAWILENPEIAPKGNLVNDLGWGINPEGIYHILKRLKKYDKPIYVTENGLADAKDEKRTEFIKNHLYWISKAIQEGIDVRGYFHWSLLDNFEFVEIRGFWPRFGLIEVNYETMERKIRPSAFEYKKIIEESAIKV